MKPFALTIFATAIGTALPAYAGASCEVKSGATTAALVELYTSEGCSSCPPADRQLSLLGQQSVGQIVPLALHVSYWDAIGWKDPYAQKAFDMRQSALLANRKNHVVYTPQFFVNGNELRAWRSDFPAAIRAINSKPAPLDIQLKVAATGTNVLTLTADVIPHEQKRAGVLYVAITENALTSVVSRGENSGVTLKHEYVARAWFGPIPLVQGGLGWQQRVELPAAWQRRQLQAVAFVQDARDGNVLQAVSTAQCNLRGES
ncbi:DUF1223 domain-containing protein [Herminiimonas sp. KBW02]|uniref:DUF1223 domain-containing protein n=1 Tax=Herminiimonas sp. KBW02 TaxID=2153363 RepID=UPI000F5A6DE9|nr:DUF1223 domain-containing protein [Herminiimonas sp. KBW02]RQO37444.1 DUF1223 domain-containing protein [Herminiimonas sp. KBW02]